MIIGVDFDNTIICYDDVFYSIARERNLIPESVAKTKEAVRDYLRNAGHEDEWIELQGFVYGARLNEAPPFEGIHEFFSRCKEGGVPLRIISHKTIKPVRGPAYDLHQAALNWLEDRGFLKWLERKQIFFEVTKERKAERILRERCTHFIDDLPEFLADPLFPSGVHRILFSPHKAIDTLEYDRLRNWAEAERLLRHSP